MRASRERRRHAERMVRHELLTKAPVGYDAQVVYVVGCLVCDDTGMLRKTDLAAALMDPDTVSDAMNILARCGVSSHRGVMN